MSSLDEFTSPSLTSTNWNKLTHVNEDDINFISQLTVDYSEVKIDLDCKNRSVTILGPQVMVLEVKNKISNQKQPSCKKRSVALEKAMVKKDVKSKVAYKKWL